MKERKGYLSKREGAKLTTHTHKHINPTRFVMMMKAHTLPIRTRLGGRGIRVTWIHVLATVGVFLCILSVSLFMYSVTTGPPLEGGAGYPSAGSMNRNRKGRALNIEVEDHRRWERGEWRLHEKRNVTTHRDRLRLIHARAVIPTQYFMKARSALDRELSQAQQPPQGKKEKSGVLGWVGSLGSSKKDSNSNARVRVVDVAFEGIREAERLFDAERGVRDPAPPVKKNGDSYLVDSLTWNIGAKLLNKQQKLSLLKDNPDDTIWSPPSFTFCELSNPFGRYMA